jgi:arginine decarboxylase
MKNTYFDLIEQTYYFPQEGFDLRDGNLTFHGVSLKHLIEKHGTPFRFIYLPKIGDQIKKARNLFNRAIKNSGYKGRYHFCYCTKCNHFYHVINEALKHKVDLETSSSFDIDLIINLHHKNKIDKDRLIVHNGFKTEDYLRKIVKLQEEGFTNSIIILDSKNELDRLLKIKTGAPFKVGLRMAINEEAQSAYYTSRLGIPPDDIIDIFKNSIRDNDRVELKMLHFFVDSGIKEACIKEHVKEPDIFTEFGRYTVGEAGAIIFEVLEQKMQNDTETWYIINNSLMNTIPDAWSIHEKFILLPVNKWDNEYGRANIGGISCDHSDYYNSEDLNQEVLLPKYSNKEKEPLYLGFFHTGAYQDSISGYGGIKHCLIPSPKHVIIDRDAKGNIIDHVYREEQSVSEMFNILGYNE